MATLALWYRMPSNQPADFLTTPLNASLRRVTLTSACAMRVGSVLIHVKAFAKALRMDAVKDAKFLKQTLKEIKPSAGLSDHELSQGIEQLEQAIKDYSPRPLQDINDTLIAQDGHVHVKAFAKALRMDAVKDAKFSFCALTPTPTIPALMRVKIIS